MILEIVNYGHPSLRTRGRKITKIDERLRQFAADMIETVNAVEDGAAGLAAQQVGRPLQLFILNVVQWSERPSQMWKDGKSIPFDHLMPLVVINPVIQTDGEIISDGEGCLSFPGVYSKIERPERVHLHAQNLEGETIDFIAEGFLARAIQHEFDHLQGVLFIDRMDTPTRQELEPQIKTLAAQYIAKTI